MHAGTLVRDQARGVVSRHIVMAVAAKVQEELTFGDYFERLMLQTFANREQLGRAAGVDPTTIGRWINNSRVPNLDNLRAVAPHLGVRLGDLMVRAGLATKEELGTVGAPPPPGPPLTQAERIQRSRFIDPSKTERYKRAFHAAMLRAIGDFDEVVADLAASPVEPRMRRR